jgi:hypothetical protein
MRKPSDSHKETKDKHNAGETGPQASPAETPAAKTWPFAPGSQLGKQVARPWTPKPAYRFNQR